MRGFLEIAIGGVLADPETAGSENLFVCVARGSGDLQCQKFVEPAAGIEGLLVRVWAAIERGDGRHKSKIKRKMSFHFDRLAMPGWRKNSFA